MQPLVVDRRWDRQETDLSFLTQLSAWCPSFLAALVPSGTRRPDGPVTRTVNRPQSPSIAQMQRLGLFGLKAEGRDVCLAASLQELARA